MQYFVRYTLHSPDVDHCSIVADIYPATEFQIYAQEAGVLNPGEYVVSDIAEVYKVADEVRDHTVIMPNPDELPF